MKILTAILLLNAFVAVAQEKNDLPCQSEPDTLTNVRVFRFVDNMPSVEGGMSVLFKEASKRLKYSRVDKRAGVETKVIVAFIVGPDGRITGERIIKNITGTDIAQQLLEIVEDLKWQPGTCNGKAVHTLQIIPMIIEVG